MMFQSDSHAGTVDYLSLDEIRRDGGTQPRAAINLQHVKLLEAQMEDGQQLEPVTIFYDGESYWLADGFHRWHAHKNQGEEVIACFIHSLVPYSQI
ncbi:MAG: ParB N-terminal domain-containing protein [Scytonema sp. PMC 1069.18]|nr:ParB N-terminal domain-containing protein [Scytonema sp. PMC 1069.18]MEC4884799.1 ParB N-terminal domain-containing protein [Scytonema sp. PMC 1070.18]